MARRHSQPVHGWVNLDKPKGVSSAKAVAIVRRVFNAAKAGHGGTLDPLASGILPIALGEATKTVSFAMGNRKSYQVTLTWGAETSTDDAEGEVTHQSDKRPIDTEIDSALPRFVGEIDQVPPIYSAIKVDGRRAYDVARRAPSLDGVPTLTPRQIRIDAFRRIDSAPDYARFFVTCGKGAYIRALARDLGRALGTAAHVTDLRRLSVGNFHADRAISLDFLESLPHSAAALEHLHPVASALDDIPALPITDIEAAKLRHGQSIAVTSPSAQRRFIALHNGVTGIALNGHQPVALVRIKDGAVCPIRVLNL